MIKGFSLSRRGLKFPSLPPYLKYDLVFWGFLCFSFLVPIFLAFSMEALAFKQRFEYMGIAGNGLLIVNSVAMVGFRLKGNLARADYLGVIFCGLNSLLLPFAFVYRFILTTASTLPPGIKKDNEAIWLVIDLLCLAVVVFHYYGIRNRALFSNTRLPGNFFPFYTFLFSLQIITLIFA